MKKFATIIGSLICLSIMKKPKTRSAQTTINNYFIKSGCGGNCKCGHH